MKTQRFPLYFLGAESYSPALAVHINLLFLPREMVKMGRVIYLSTHVSTLAWKEREKRRKGGGEEGEEKHFAAMSYHQRSLSWPQGPKAMRLDVI